MAGRHTGSYLFQPPSVDPFTGASRPSFDPTLAAQCVAELDAARDAKPFHVKVSPGQKAYQPPIKSLVKSKVEAELPVPISVHPGVSSIVASAARQQQQLASPISQEHVPRTPRKVEERTVVHLHAPPPYGTTDVVISATAAAHAQQVATRIAMQQQRANAQTAEVRAAGVRVNAPLHPSSSSVPLASSFDSLSLPLPRSPEAVRSLQSSLEALARSMEVAVSHGHGRSPSQSQPRTNHTSPQQAQRQHASPAYTHSMHQLHGYNQHTSPHAPSHTSPSHAFANLSVADFDSMANQGQEEEEEDIRPESLPPAGQRRIAVLAADRCMSESQYLRHGGSLQLAHPTDFVATDVGKPKSYRKKARKAAIKASRSGISTPKTNGSNTRATTRASSRATTRATSRATSGYTTPMWMEEYKEPAAAPASSLGREGMMEIVPSVRSAWAHEQAEPTRSNQFQHSAATVSAAQHSHQQQMQDEPDVHASILPTTATPERLQPTISSSSRQHSLHATPSSSALTTSSRPASAKVTPSAGRPTESVRNYAYNFVPLPPTPPIIPAPAAAVVAPTIGAASSTATTRPASAATTAAVTPARQAQIESLQSQLQRLQQQLTQLRSEASSGLSTSARSTTASSRSELRVQPANAGIFAQIVNANAAVPTSAAAFRSPPPAASTNVASPATPRTTSSTATSTSTHRFTSPAHNLQLGSMVPHAESGEVTRTTLMRVPDKPFIHPDDEEELPPSSSPTSFKSVSQDSGSIPSGGPLLFHRDEPMPVPRTSRRAPGATKEGAIPYYQHSHGKKSFRSVI